MDCVHKKILFSVVHNKGAHAIQRFPIHVMIAKSYSIERGLWSVKVWKEQEQELIQIYLENLWNCCKFLLIRFLVDGSLF